MQITKAILLLAFFFSFKIISQTRLPLSDYSAIAERYYLQNTQNIPGMAVVISHKGNIISKSLLGSYRLSDKKEFDSKNSILNLGKISETIIALSLLKISEDKKVDLTSDVNTYLSKKIKIGGSKGLSILQLLLHSDGLVYHPFGKYSLAPNPKDLQYNSITRNNDSGEFAYNSEVSYLILYNLIKDLDKTPFQDIFLKKIGMASSYISIYNLPSEKLTDYVPGYIQSNGFWKKLSALYAQQDIDLYSSIEDITNLLNFLSGLSQNKDKPIINKESLDRVLNRQYEFSYLAENPGITLAFYENILDEKKILYKDSLSLSSSAKLLLLPEEDLSIFIYIHSPQKNIIEEFSHNLIKSIYPYTDPTENNKEDLSKEEKKKLEEYEGYYKPIDNNESSFIKFLNLFNVIQISVNSNSNLILKPSNFFYKETFFNKEEFKEEQPLLFKGNKLENYLSFRLDNVGNITHLYSTGNAHTTYQKLKWYHSPNFQLLVVGLSLAYYGLVFLFILGGYIFHAIGNFKVRTAHSQMLTIVKTIKLLIFISSFWIASFLLSLMYLLNLNEIPDWNIPSFYVQSASQYYYIVFTFPIVAVSISPFVIYTTLKAMSDGNLSNYRKIKYLGFLFLSSLFYFWLNYWNLLGYNF